MARPVSYNVKEKPLERDISMVDMPDGYQGEGFFASKLSDVVGLARKNSITTWPVLVLNVLVSLHGNVIC
jgi:NADH-quinone oxidoreductase subunit B